jgi:hypothetical protein
MRNSSLRQKCFASTPDGARPECAAQAGSQSGESRTASHELGIVRGRAAEETRALVRRCIPQSFGSLFGESPVHAHCMHSIFTLDLRAFDLRVFDLHAFEFHAR